MAIRHSNVWKTLHWNCEACSHSYKILPLNDCANYFGDSKCTISSLLILDYPSFIFTLLWWITLKMCIWIQLILFAEFVPDVCFQANNKNQRESQNLLLNSILIWSLLALILPKTALTNIQNIYAISVLSWFVTRKLWCTIASLYRVIVGIMQWSYT